jgi:hypothetical protein
MPGKQFAYFMELCLVQGDRKVTQPIPNTCPICQNVNYIGIRKQKKTMLYQVLEMSTAFSDVCIHSFSHV